MLDQPVDAIKRDPAIIADDAAAPIGVGQAGQDMRAAAAADVVGIGVEHAVIVGLAILGEDLDDLRVGLVAEGLQRVRTIRKPPFGMIARFSGASVCRPTMISLSLSM